MVLTAIKPDKMPLLSTWKILGQHKIEGIGDDFIPKLVKKERIDKILQINDDAVNMARKLSKELGLGVGISSGANFIGSILLANEIENNVVTVFADDNKKYLSTDLIKDIDLNNGPKYGVQAYDGATVILNNVSITGFRYGGVLVNGGNLEIIDLHLGTNGTGANNGIEIDKGASATNNPTLTMNGTLSSDSTENVVRPADNGNLTEFTVTNTENTTNKIVIAGDKVVLTDENNKVISESSIPDNVTSNTNEAKKVIVTLIIGGEAAKQITVDEGATITADLLKADVKIEEGYEIEGFYTEQEYKNKFDFDTKLTEDTTIYARIAEIKAEEPEKPTQPAPEPEKDDEPKTGVESYLGVAVMAIVASVAGLYFVRKTAEK